MILKDWLELNKLKVFFIQQNIVSIDDILYVVVEEKEKLFDSEFNFILSDDEVSLLSTHNTENVIFLFGDQWYYSNIKDVKLNLLKYLGKSIDSEYNIYPNLAIHGKYELLNGSRDYKDWCLKAKFLGISTLAITEQQTLSGAYYFQQACDEYNIKSIIGQQTLVKNDKYEYYVKLYCINKSGYSNLLKINKIQIVDNAFSSKHIDENQLLQLSDGLVCVLGVDTKLYNINIDSYKKSFSSNLYYQFDCTEFSSNKKDKENLLNLKLYLEKYLHIIDPIIMSDSYYLDKEDAKIKKILNQIGKLPFKNESKNQYFKDYSQLMEEVLMLFNESSKELEYIIEKSDLAYRNIEDNCNFKIKRERIHLPEYILNENELTFAKDSKDLFFQYLEEGFKLKVSNLNKDESIYINRLNKEVEVLEEGNVIDYFMILADVVKWCQQRSIITGLGRGSAAGCLVSYLLNITEVDPIEYDLLFERFLNKARLLGGSLPDLDFDIPSKHRKDIIEYLSNKYGSDQVAYIGTAQTLKLKSIVKDLLRIKGMDFKQSNIITSLIDKENEYSTKLGLFKLATKEPRLKKLIQEYHQTIELIDLSIFQPRSFGIHAAGIVIAPKKDKYGNDTTIFDYMPIRKEKDGNITEWEKDAVEAIGMLKEDLLGLTQLDKFMRMIELIKVNHGVNIDIKKIALNNESVFNLFKDGMTEDIFQFGSEGLKDYCKYLKPDNVNDLIAANALYRPGAMDSQSHIQYVKIKQKKIERDVYPMLEDIVESSNSLFIYQEQVMLAYQRITQCDLNEADNFRKVISKTKPGKKNIDIEPYENEFKIKYLELCGDQNKVNEVWDKIGAFASYSFNRSHSAAYAITGYISQWFKYKYPLEFYTTALEFSSDESMISIIEEIFKMGSIQLKNPDINKSERLYSIDKETNTIYWSISSISNAGEVAVNQLIEERTKNGKFYSFTDFLSRITSKINKRVVTNLILTGCFDEIEGLKRPTDRVKLLNRYYENELPETLQSENFSKDYYWISKQKELCGYGFIDYSKLFASSKVSTNRYFSAQDLQNELSQEQYGGICGTITKVVERKIKNGIMYSVILQNNDKNIHVTVWPDFNKSNPDTFKNSINKVMSIIGVVKRDDFKKCNTLHVNSRSKYQMF